MGQEGESGLAGRVLADVGGAFAVALAYIGDRLGLFRYLAQGGRCSSETLARAAGLKERYIREWLNGMVASEYVEYDGHADRYYLTAEQRRVLVDESSTVFSAGAFQFALPSLLYTPRLMDLFRSGGGIPFASLTEEIAQGIDRMHRPWFEHLLTHQWLPTVPGLDARLERGLSVLDVGCGCGRSSVAVAHDYPACQVVGIDPHGPSLQKARHIAWERGISNVSFLETTLEDMPAVRYDLILAIDCIHDLADPVGALGIIRQRLAADGLFFWSEPAGSHDPMLNRYVPARLSAVQSPFHSLLVSLAEGGDGLGALIGETGARELAVEAGFAHFERLPLENPTQQFFVLRS